MKVAPISELNLSASSSSSGLPSADLTADDTMSLSLTLLPGWLGLRNISVNFWKKIKWVPENLYTFSMAGYIVNVYKFSGTHLIEDRSQWNKILWSFKKPYLFISTL